MLTSLNHDFIFPRISISTRDTSVTQKKITGGRFIAHCFPFPQTGRVPLDFYYANVVRGDSSVASEITEKLRDSRGKHPKKLIKCVYFSRAVCVFFTMTRFLRLRGTNSERLWKYHVCVCEDSGEEMQICKYANRILGRGAPIKTSIAAQFGFYSFLSEVSFKIILITSNGNQTSYF